MVEPLSWTSNAGACACDAYKLGKSKNQSFTWFSGFRYLNVNRRLNIGAQHPVANAVEQETNNVRSQDNLCNGQLGTRLRRTYGRLGWDASGFAGTFGNDAERNSIKPSRLVRPSNRKKEKKGQAQRLRRQLILVNFGD